MRFRHLSIVLFGLAAACATPTAKPPPSRPLPVAPPPQAVAPPPPTVEAPPISPVTPPAVSGDMIFDAWAAEFYSRAIKAGIPRDLLEREMAGLTPDPRVAQRDSRQPEFSQPISVYIKGAVTDGAAAAGGR